MAAADFVVLAPGATRYLQITGLSRALRAADEVELTFRFDDGTTVTATTPVATPSSPLPRSPMQFDEEH
jgi:copper(I)-binding protein